MKYQVKATPCSKRLSFEERHYKAVLKVTEFITKTRKKIVQILET